MRCSTKQVRVPKELHSALERIQRKFKKTRGEEPSLGELLEKAFEEDPVLYEVLRKERQTEKESRSTESYMKL